MLKYSRQRESIKTYLMQTKEHPTADMVYLHMKETYPNISLGTVYRNLSLLTEIGEVNKLTSCDGADRFDGNTAPHYHFTCDQCHNVYDLEMESIEHINLIAAQNFDGEITGHTAQFHGICGQCMKRKK